MLNDPRNTYSEKASAELMAPAQSAARRPLRGFRRIGRHKVLRRHVVGEDSKISHTTTPDTQAGSVIIAKEGELCLKHTGFKLEVIDWDHAQTISWRVDPGCEHSFVPLSHIRRLDEYVKHAAGTKFDFERGLRKILQSDIYGNSRVVWRLEFEDEALHCSQEKHDEICKEFGIISLLELVCSGRSLILDPMSAQVLLHEPQIAAIPEAIDRTPGVVGSVELLELSKQDSAAKGFENDVKVHKEPPKLADGTGNAVIAQGKGTASLKERRDDELAERSDTVYPPNTRLEILGVLLEKSLGTFMTSISSADVKRQGRASELCYDDTNEAELFRQVALRDVINMLCNSVAASPQIPWSRTRRSRASRPLLTGKIFVCPGEVQFGSKDHVCAERFRYPSSLESHMREVHKYHKESIYEPSGYINVFPVAVNSQSHVIAGLEVLKNIAFVVAPIIGMIYSHDSWLLSL
jgi:hypothetical protein